MAILGINIDKNNPPFTKEEFLIWMPQFSQLEDLDTKFNYFYRIANDKVFSSIFGTDWPLAMSLCIAHYLTLVAINVQVPQGSTLATIAGGGATKGVLASATIGGFSKTYDLDRTMVASDEAKWWNQTSYGAQFMALYKTKGVPSILVVTSGPVPGAN